jgi:hypothetical protein
MAELLATEPLFHGKNELEQLDKVFDFCELSLLLIQLIFDDIMVENFLFSYLEPYAHLMKRFDQNIQNYRYIKIILFYRQFLHCELKRCLEALGRKTLFWNIKYLNSAYSVVPIVFFRMFVNDSLYIQSLWYTHLNIANYWPCHYT